MNKILFNLLVISILFICCFSPASAYSPVDSEFALGDDLLIPPYYNSDGSGRFNLKSDCDDVAIFTYLTFRYMGYNKVDIMYGNLSLIGEQYYSCNHYWVIVNENRKQYAYDNGICYKDSQYYEGYKISYKELLYWATVDQ